jgi:hypothetical protein
MQPGHLQPYHAMKTGKVWIRAKIAVFDASETTVRDHVHG